MSKATDEAITSIVQFATVEIVLNSTRSSPEQQKHLVELNGFRWASYFAASTPLRDCRLSFVVPEIGSDG